MSSKNLLDGIKTKPILLAAERVLTNLFVRTELNQDHAMYLACLVDDQDAQVVLPPILVIPEFEINGDGEIHFVVESDKFRIVDGRHRFWAWTEILDQAEVKALVITDGIKTRADLTALAYRLNCGGPLPPTNADTEHTVETLLELKVPKKRIGEMLGLPPGLARKFVNNIESRLERAKIRRAVNSIAENPKTVAEAAREQGIEPEKVRKFIAGKTGGCGTKDDMEMIRREVSADYKSMSSRNAARMRALLEQYDDGDLNAKDVFNVFRQIEALQKKSASALGEWRKRFEAKIQTGK